MNSVFFAVVPCVPGKERRRGPRGSELAVIASQPASLTLPHAVPRNSALRRRGSCERQRRRSARPNRGVSPASAQPDRLIRRSALTLSADNPGAGHSPCRGLRRHRPRTSRRSPAVRPSGPHRTCDWRATLAGRSPQLNRHASSLVGISRIPGCDDMPPETRFARGVRPVRPHTSGQAAGCADWRASRVGAGASCGGPCIRADV